MQLRFQDYHFPDNQQQRSAQDLFGHHYGVALTPYQGLDFSKRCFVFPGQSAAAPGMGLDDYNRFDLVQKRFMHADALAEKYGVPAPSLYITSPGRVPPEQVPLVQCMALFTMSVALFELLLVHNERPALLTSHSFGEYAMLVAAGIATFEDMFAVVIERDRVCPKAGDAGMMIAVSATEKAVHDALMSVPVALANINSPSQVVVALATEQQKATVSALKKAKLAHKLLDNIPQPYHSNLLADAAARLLSFIQKRRFKFSTPRLPVFSSVLGKCIDAATFDEQEITKLLAAQLTTPINFTAQLQKIALSGVRNFIELAHVRVCTPWIKDIFADNTGKVTVPPVLMSEARMVAASAKTPTRQYDKKLVGLLNKVVSSVTGYSINEISLNNNFQEDLGIDSIKKAQIILSFLESQGELGGNLRDGVAMSEIKNIEDVLAWYMRDRSNAAADVVDAGQFARYAPDWQPQAVNAVDQALAQPAKNYTWISVQQAEERLAAALAAAIPFDGVVFYDDGTAFDFYTWMDAMHACYNALRKTEATFTLVYVCDSGSPAEHKALDGYLKSIAKELSRPYRVIYVQDFNLSQHKEKITDELALPFMAPVKLLPQQRYVQTLLPRPARLAAVPSTVAAIGGTRGVTFELLKALLSAGTHHVAIFGRRQPESVQEDIAALQACNPAANILYFAGDATQSQALAEFVRQTTANFGAIDLLIHAGGVELSALTLQQTRDAVRAQTEIKIATTRMLAALAEHYPINTISCFSSVAGEFGSPGQTVYSYANIAMTYLAEEYNQRLGRPLFKVIAWPAWNRVGMTDNEDTYKQMVLAGVKFLEIADGCRLFLEDLADGDCARSVCVAAASFMHDRADALQSAVLNHIFPGASQLRSPLPLLGWTLRSIPDLRHHNVLEHAVVPMSLSVGTLFYMAYLETGQAFKLENVKALSFMLLHQKESPYFLDYRRLGTDRAAGFMAELRSNETHLTATLSPLEDADLAAIPPYAQPDEKTLLQMDSQYDVHNLGKGDFKEGFGVLKGVRANAEGYSYATLPMNPPPLRLGPDPVNWVTMVVESLLQLGGVGARVLSQKANAPVSLAKVVVNPSARRTNTYQAVCKCEIISDDVATGHMYAYNEDGEIFVHIQDAQVRMWGFDEK